MPSYFETGFSVRQPSWHREELLLDESQRPQTWDEARPLAGLDWEYVVEPMYTRNLTGMSDAGEPTYDFQPASGFQVIKRDDTHDVIHAAADSYEVISVAEMGEIIHTITDEEKLNFETAGSVRNGAQIWGLIRLDEDHHLSNGSQTDPSATRPYLGISNRTDGRGSCKAFATSVRIVCWNTLSAAEAQSDRDGTVATFRHQKNWRNHIESARQAIRGARKEWEDWKALAADLMGMPIDDATAEKFVTTFIPEPPETEMISKLTRTNIEKARNNLREVIWASQTTRGIEGSGYWLAQSAAEYLDHMRSYKTQDSYVRRTLLRPEKGKALAVRMIRELTKESGTFTATTEPVLEPASAPASPASDSASSSESTPAASAPTSTSTKQRAKPAPKPGAKSKGASTKQASTSKRTTSKQSSAQPSSSDSE